MRGRGVGVPGLRGARLCRAAAPSGLQAGKIATGRPIRPPFAVAGSHGTDTVRQTRSVGAAQLAPGPKRMSGPTSLAAIVRGAVRQVDLILPGSCHRELLDGRWISKPVLCDEYCGL